MINAIVSVSLEIDLNLWTIITFVCNDQEKQLHFLRDHECLLGKVSHTTGKGQLHEARLLRAISPDPFFPSTAPHSLFEAIHARCHLWKRSATWSSPSKGDLTSLVLSLRSSPQSLWGFPCTLSSLKWYQLLCFRLSTLLPDDRHMRRQRVFLRDILINSQRRHPLNDVNDIVRGELEDNSLLRSFACRCQISKSFKNRLANLCDAQTPPPVRDKALGKPWDMQTPRGAFSQITWDSIRWCWSRYRLLLAALPWYCSYGNWSISLAIFITPW
jgi:hypothetical protein